MDYMPGQLSDLAYLNLFKTDKKFIACILLIFGVIFIVDSLTVALTYLTSRLTLFIDHFLIAPLSFSRDVFI